MIDPVKTAKIQQIDNWLIFFSALEEKSSKEGVGQIYQ
jgi:hypothetical protein